MKPAARHVPTVSADTPFAERLRGGLSYPVRGAALPTAVALALAHYVGLLPMYIGSLASLLIWAATWRYAAECMMHTAHGFAEPPDVGLDEAGSAGWGLTAIHLLALGLGMLVALLFPHALWPLLIVIALALPAIDMSLAFDGDMAVALNPLNWGRIVAGFGVAYLIPVTINLLLGLLILLASLLSAQLPRLLALPLFAFSYTYLVVLGFHLMGALIHQRHERFGLVPESEALVTALGQDADQQLLAEVHELARTDPAAATRLLVPRLQDRQAPDDLHQAYRDLLRRQDMREGLLVHGQIRIASFIAQGEPRRALGMLQDCRALDPAFIPDDPRTCGELADLAARLGMRRIAGQLCVGYLAHWPRDTQGPHYGLLAARLLDEDDEQRSEAARLLDQLLQTWPEHPLRHDMQVAARQLAASPPPVR